MSSTIAGKRSELLITQGAFGKPRLLLSGWQLLISANVSLHGILGHLTVLSPPEGQPFAPYLDGNDST